MISWLREMLQDTQNSGCRAVVDDELCGRDVFGRNGSGEIRFCRRHVPNEASPHLHRTNPVTFYLPEEDEYVTKS